ncbi:MAG: DUF4956 domain-containing protein [Bacteroidota bacterium]
MLETLERIFARYSSTIDFREFLFHLGWTALLCFGVSLLYVAVTPGGRRSVALARAIPAAGMVMALVSTVIASSLAIAIGLVGAISVIRFRAVLKDIGQLIFLFLALTMGLACGIGQALTATAALVVFALILLPQHWMQEGQAARYGISIRGAEARFSGLMPALQDQFPDLELRHLHEAAGRAEWRFSWRPADFQDIQRLYELLSNWQGLNITLHDEDPPR